MVRFPIFEHEGNLKLRLPNKQEQAYAPLQNRLVRREAKMQLKGFSYKLFIVPLVLMALWQSGSSRSSKTETMLNERTPVATGIWGGPSVRLNVTDGGGEIQLGCAHGTIQQPLTLNSEGRFSAKGAFVAESPGPIHVDKQPKSQPALYSGSVTGQSMTLVITVTETKKEIGTFALKHGVAGRVRRCL